ncbi:MAG: SusD/RagB family nutrient-binding outer membrane lipoprotein [Sphingobacteriaceae bacterium]|nr:MAG: SusD/RagB family nutrient-binding outer membrane lipoprotein [Sphingobacteriaceae bacterium]
MKNKFIYILSTLTLFSMLTPSCKKDLNINTNPNSAEKVDPKLLFSTAVVQYITKRSDGDLWIPIALAGQTVASGGNTPEGLGWGSPFEEQYIFDPLIFGNPWRYFYSTMGAGLKQAILLSETATPANKNAAAQCKVVLAMNFFDLTTIYGDVPYSEALNVGITYPKFDSQQQVLEGVVAICDDALAEFDDASPLKISDYDLFYKGDLSKWKKLARSVKLRALMTMVDKDPSKAAAIGALITAGDFISSSADDALVPWSTVAGRENPKYRMISQYYGGVNPFHASKRIVDFMNGLEDPRLPFYFDRPEGIDEYIGIENGADGDDVTFARVSLDMHRKDAPEIFFSYQEQLFFEAEIQARGLGVPVNMSEANTLFRRAVAASVNYWTKGENDGVAFAETLPSLTSMSSRAAVKYIHMHHWVDEMDRAIDAFTQFRRSGPEGDEVPALTKPIGAAAGGLFRRYEYPQSNEILLNPNSPKERIKYDTKMWFDL